MTQTAEILQRCLNRKQLDTPMQKVCNAPLLKVKKEDPKTPRVEKEDIELPRMDPKPIHDYITALLRVSFKTNSPQLSHHYPNIAQYYTNTSFYPQPPNKKNTLNYPMLQQMMHPLPIFNLDNYHCMYHIYNIITGKKETIDSLLQGNNK